ncbi:DUF6744 family protein [Paenibacillus hunanensis]|uniref:Uncharacterized protein n=1 Tax=Paenibacillus hunanensis TaxID=539262 RepID=A0ABU1IWW6_9BACL|nr:DUF6744 family protein [Paenibacillus hunanensis]MDR6243500.1 hypothetical protein [Paenibacillus hunanensis]GGI98201.1 hypothetical protein GCM10008022_03630 [Paenibacillus hunanensis]
MNSILNNMAAVGGQAPTDIIGHLTWAGVGAMLITRDELKQKLIDSGLGEGWMPKPIRLPDAFRRATSAKFRQELPDGKIENYMFREVTSNKQTVQRNLVCETVDTKGRRLDYDGAAGIVILDKNTDTIDTSHTSPIASQMVQNAVLRFDICKNHYESTTLRTVMTNVLKSMSPTPVRQSGGVYFVPKQFDLELQAYIEFIRSLEKGESEKIPVINTNDMRGMITRKLLEHLKGTLYACKAGVDNQLRKAELKTLLDDAKRIVEDYKQYESIVTGDLKDMEQLCLSIRQNIAVALQNMADD